MQSQGAPAAEAPGPALTEVATDIVQVLVRLISQSRDAGRERMLIGVLRSLGAVSEGSTANAAKVIAARGVVPAFQLLGSRLPAVRQVRRLTGCADGSRQHWQHAQWLQVQRHLCAQAVG